MSDDLMKRITVEAATRAASNSALASRIDALESSLASGSVTKTSTTNTDENRSRLKQAKDGLLQVVKTIWTVPAAQSFVATLLVRLGVPGTLVAIGMAVGDKLAG